jgi:hypothetical protein
MNVRLHLILAGDEGAEQWKCNVSSDDRSSRFRRCCEEGPGHGSPEEAASHGASVAVGVLCADVRRMRPPQLGAIVLARTG